MMDHVITIGDLVWVGAYGLGALGMVLGVIFIISMVGFNEGWFR